MRWLTNVYDFSFKWTATAAIGIHPTKAWLSQLVNFKNAIWTLEEGYAIKFCFKLGKMPQKRMKCFWNILHESSMKARSTAMTQRPWDRVPNRSMLAIPDPRRTNRANPPTNFSWSLLFLTPLAWSTCTGFPLDRQSTRNTMLRFFKGVQEEIPSEEASTLQIGSVAFPAGQCTSPQLHPCHRLLDQDGHQDSSQPSL